MNKRLRKKKRRGEFNWLGFEFECRFDPELGTESDAQGNCEVDRFLDAYIAFIESLSLGTGGGTGPRQMGQFVIKYVPGKRRPNGRTPHRHVHCTEEDRSKVEAWLRSHPFVVDLVFSALIPSN